ncbi:MAG: hypothetical protein JWN64_161 [Parcubacteria group bacterium]|nr:hypothetical protein [Parcubacteria group bacterium]
MDKKSKIFLWLFAFVILASVGVTYYRYVVIQNFDIFLPEPEQTIDTEEASSTPEVQI